MEHVGSYTEKKPLSNYAVNIDQLERLTDFDFFCNLPDETENAVEKSYKASDWDNLQ
jgi:endonuclease G